MSARGARRRGGRRERRRIARRGARRPLRAQVCELDVAHARLADEVRAEPRERGGRCRRSRCRRPGRRRAGAPRGRRPAVDHLARLRVDPLRVLDHDHERLVVRDAPASARATSSTRAAPAASRACRRAGEVPRSDAALTATRADLADHGDELDEGRRRPGRRPRELASPGRRGALGSSSARRISPNAASGTPALVSRQTAAATCSISRPTRRSGRPRLQQRRLPAARRSGQEDDAAASGGGVRGGGGQRVQLPLAADHGGGHGQVIPPPPNGCKRTAEGYPGLRCPTWP